MYNKKYNKYSKKTNYLLQQFGGSMLDEINKKIKYKKTHCSQTSFSQHISECWNDSIQMMFCFSDSLKNETQNRLLNLTPHEIIVKSSLDNRLIFLNPIFKKNQHELIDVFVINLEKYIGLLQYRLCNHLSYIVHDKYSIYGSEETKDDDPIEEPICGKLDFEKIYESYNDPTITNIISKKSPAALIRSNSAMCGIGSSVYILKGLDHKLETTTATPREILLTLNALSFALLGDNNYINVVTFDFALFIEPRAPVNMNDPDLIGILVWIGGPSGHIVSFYTCGGEDIYYNNEKNYCNIVPGASGTSEDSTYGKCRFPWRKIFDKIDSNTNIWFKSSTPDSAGNNERIYIKKNDTVKIYDVDPITFQVEGNIHYGSPYGNKVATFYLLYKKHLDEESLGPLSKFISKDVFSRSDKEEISSNLSFLNIKKIVKIYNINVYLYNEIIDQLITKNIYFSTTNEICEMLLDDNIKKIIVILKNDLIIKKISSVNELSSIRVDYIDNLIHMGFLTETIEFSKDGSVLDDSKVEILLKYYNVRPITGYYVLKYIPTIDHRHYSSDIDHRHYSSDSDSDYDSDDDVRDDRSIEEFYSTYVENEKKREEEIIDNVIRTQGDMTTEELINIGESIKHVKLLTIDQIKLINRKFLDVLYFNEMINETEPCLTFDKIMSTKLEEFRHIVYLTKCNINFTVDELVRIDIEKLKLLKFYNLLRIHAFTIEEIGELSTKKNNVLEILSFWNFITKINLELSDIFTTSVDILGAAIRNNLLIKNKYSLKDIFNLEYKKFNLLVVYGFVNVYNDYEDLILPVHKIIEFSEKLNLAAVKKIIHKNLKLSSDDFLKLKNDNIEILKMLIDKQIIKNIILEEIITNLTKEILIKLIASEYITHMTTIVLRFEHAILLEREILDILIKRNIARGPLLIPPGRERDISADKLELLKKIKPV